MKPAPDFVPAVAAKTLLRESRSGALATLMPGSGAWSSVLALYADLPFMQLFELAADDLCGPVTSLRATSAVATGN